MMLIEMRKCSNSVPLLEEYPRQWGVSSSSLLKCSR